MDMSLMGLIKTMSWPALAIFFLLCLLSVYSLAVSVERWMTFQKAKHQSVKFALEVGQLLKQDKLKEAIDLAKKYKNSHVAKVVSGGPPGVRLRGARRGRAGARHRRRRRSARSSAPR